MRLSDFVAAAVVGSLCFFGVGHAAPSPASGAALGESMPASLGDGTLDGIRKAFETRFPDVDVTGVRQTPYVGLYEVQIGMDVVYTDAKVDYVLQGSLIETIGRASCRERVCQYV